MAHPVFVVRRASFLLAIGLWAVGCGPAGPVTTPVPGPTSGINPAWSYAGKSRVAEGTQAMVVAGSPIAAEVGREILRAGGNAVDAATAVGFAMAVVHPEAGNIGGGGFSMIRMTDGSVTALDYREASPSCTSTSGEIPPT
jgi:gamma-glutamyltranspeptidase/glutathione hydrolase